MKAPEPKRGDIQSSIYHILDATGRPMTRQEIIRFSPAETMGKRLDAKQVKKALSNGTLIGRFISDGNINMDRRKWWIAGHAHWIERQAMARRKNVAIVATMPKSYQDNGNRDGFIIAACGIALLGIVFWGITA